MRRKHGVRADFARRESLCRYSSNGDQAGSEAKFLLGIDCSLRPVRSMVFSRGPPVPASWLKNISTRPFGAQVGPSWEKPVDRMRSPYPSVFMTPIENWPPDCLVKAIRSPRGDHTGVE